MTSRERLDALLAERRDILAEIKGLDTKRLNDDLDHLTFPEMDRLSQLSDRKAVIATESIQLQISLRATRTTPRAQYWDDDAPGGVVYE